MTFPVWTAAYAGLFALLFTALSIHVVMLRGRTGIVHADGGHDVLNRTIRAHGNFAEYVPFVLLLSALLEAGGTRTVVIHLLLAPLMIARLMHPIGMRQPVGSIRQYAWRATSMTITWIVLATAAVLLLVQSLTRA